MLQVVEGTDHTPLQRQGPDATAQAHRDAGQRLAGIQILRALAALFVVYAHLMNRNVKRGFMTGDEWWALDLGHLGVCVFFAISGIVMMHASARAFTADRKGRQALLFFKRQMIRICPLYYVTMASFILFDYVVWKRGPTIKDVIRSLLFIPYQTDSGLFQPVYGPGWSLNYEMFFYLLQCGAFAALCRIPRQRVLEPLPNAQLRARRGHHARRPARPGPVLAACLALGLGTVVAIVTATGTQPWSGR